MCTKGKVRDNYSFENLNHFTKRNLANSVKSKGQSNVNRETCQTSSNSREILLPTVEIETYLREMENTNIDENEDPVSILNSIRKKHPNMPIICHININFLEKKFESLRFMIKDRVDILMISETKLDSSFPSAQFVIEGYCEPFRLDRNCYGGGLLIFINENIPCKRVTSYQFPKDVECMILEIKFGSTKWLLIGGYNPKKQCISHFLNHVSKGIDKNLSSHENFLIMGDFNCPTSINEMKEFCETYELENLIKAPTCYKSPLNPSSIDVILTNKRKVFTSSITIETGLSDWHKMTLTVLKSYYKKQKPIKVNYRDYRNFDDNDFRNNLKRELEAIDINAMTLEKFNRAFKTTLDDHAPLKVKTIRGNHAHFMNKTLSKAVMHRSKLKNKYFKNPTNENWELFRKHRNYCVGLFKREKRNYYNNLDLKVFKDNKTFWRTIKPLFSEKTHIKNRNMIIIENDKVFVEKSEIAEKLNQFFIDSVKNLDVEPFTSENIDVEKTSDDKVIETIVRKYRSHPSILKIKEHLKIESRFEFNEMTSEEMETEIRKLNPKKASMTDDLPSKILISSHDIVGKYLTTIYNNSHSSQKYPTPLKVADVTPIPKTTDKTSLKSYRPVSLIPIISKLYERNMFDQTSAYIERFLSPYLFGYRKGHSTEQCLIVMVETWKRALDMNNAAGSILTDLSKAFDCLSHELLIAKLEAYGFGNTALKYLYDYMKNRKQRVKIEEKFSSWKDLKKGVQQGSIIGPLLFNIFINDIFLFVEKTKLANFADDTTSYSTEKNALKLLELLKEDITVILQWFRFNEMKSNTDKMHLIISDTNKNFTSTGCIYINNEFIESEKSVKLLGVTIDNKLNFNEHVTNLIKKGNQKLHAIARISKYLCENKLKLVVRTFIESQFNYCPLIWMFHSRTLNTKINYLHERALRIIYKDTTLTFEELLEKDDSVTIHDRNLQKLAIEMFKIKNHLSPNPVLELFRERSIDYQLRNERCWELPRVNTVNFGKESLTYRGILTWNLLPNDLKQTESLSSFRTKIKQWKPQGCTCRLCINYISNLGYI